jgi:hypothetical protein
MNKPFGSPATPHRQAIGAELVPGLVPNGPVASMASARSCRCHCRSCGGHFTSLEAFDAHRNDGECSWPDGVEWVEHCGVCKISEHDEMGQPIPRAVTVYALAISEKELTRLNELTVGAQEARGRAA